jgi:hypothetical protein
VTQSPAGPWVIVVGMHRSGTSAVTGAIRALGFNMARPDDLMPSHESNPEHWESRSAYSFNDKLLSVLGGRWDAPPDLDGRWDQDPDLREAGDPEAVLATAYPDPGPSVWKDPRLSLLLPYWRSHLPAPVAAVLVCRSPIAVARSLNGRNAMALVDGIAIWERYNRSAVEGLHGLDTFVVNYEAVVDDPAAFVGGLVDWLGSLDQFGQVDRTWDVDGAVASIAGELRHHPGVEPSEDDALLLDEQRALAHLLTEMAGVHHPLGRVPMGDESKWTTEIIRHRRLAGRQALPLAEGEPAGDRRLEDRLARAYESIEQLSEQLAESNRALAHSNRLLERVYTATSWRMTKPLRSSFSMIRGRRHGSSPKP